MSALDLLLSRKALAAGVGLTTRRNKVLPSWRAYPEIPDRIGVGRPKRDSVAPTVAEDRTFVISLIGGTVGTLFNKVAGVIASNLVVALSSYFVGGVKTITTSKWRDVWRFDKTAYSIAGQPVVPLTATQISFRINGSIDNAILTPVVKYYGRTALPFVCPPAGPYQDYATGDVNRSTLFISRADATSRGVASIAKVGTEITFLATPNLTEQTLGNSAGTRLKADGTYEFYGACRHMDNSGLYIVSLVTTWASIKATLASPWLELKASGLNTLAMGYAVTLALTRPYSSTALTPEHPALPASATMIRNVSGGPNSFTVDNYWGAPAQMLERRTTGLYNTSGGSINYSDTAVVSYAGSPIELTLAKSVTGSATRVNTGAEETQGIGANTYYLLNQWTSLKRNEDLTTSVVLTAPPALGLKTFYSVTERRIFALETSNGFKSSLTYTAGAYQSTTLCNAAEKDALLAKTIEPTSFGPYTVIPPTSGTQNTLPDIATQTVTDQLNITTVDYIYADLDERIYLTLESTLTYSKVVSGSTTTSFSLSIKYVLDVRGTTYNIAVYSGNGFNAPGMSPLVTAWSNSDSGNPANYYRGNVPVAAFSPAFMSQGNCPYIAYTTLAEEAAGATPEIYVDFSVRPYRYDRGHTPVDGENYTGTTWYLPNQFALIWDEYIAKVNHTTGLPTQNSNTFESLFFPSAKRIQFANGVVGPWQSAYGSTFSANPAVDISRI